jgi:hypothetical protein
MKPTERLERRHVLKNLSRIAVIFALLTGTGLAQNNPLVGIWRATESDAYGNLSTVELVFTPNSFTQSSKSSAQQTYEAGPYRILGGGMLRWYLQQTFPNQQCSTVGCSPIYWPPSEGFFYRLIGANTLQLNPSVCAQNPCPLTYTRVR